MAKRPPKQPVKETFNWRWHLAISIVLLICAMLLMVTWGMFHDRQDDIPPVNLRYKLTPPPIPATFASSVPLPQPPQPTMIPPPLDVSLPPYADDTEPEDKSTERPGCAGGACDTQGNDGWYPGKRFGRWR